MSLAYFKAITFHLFGYLYWGMQYLHKIFPQTFSWSSLSDLKTFHVWLEYRNNSWRSAATDSGSNVSSYQYHTIHKFKRKKSCKKHERDSPCCLLFPCSPSPESFQGNKKNSSAGVCLCVWIAFQEWNGCLSQLYCNLLRVLASNYRRRE